MNGKRIQYFRELKNYKRTWLAEKLGINVTQVSRIENNQSQLTVERLNQIAILLNVSVFDLFEAEQIKDLDPKNFKKYGVVESTFLRYLINQNEIQQIKNDELIKINMQLMHQMNMLNDNFKRLMDHFTAEKSSGKKSR